MPLHTTETMFVLLHIFWIIAISLAQELLSGIFPEYNMNQGGKGLYCDTLL